MPEINRRDFLKLASAGLLTASGLISAAALFRFLSYSTEPATQSEFDLGDASNFPVGSLKVVADIPAVIIHDENGFSAISLICTHLGCTVEQDADGFSCPCHGSKYSSDGKVLQGPAKKSLPTLLTEQNAEGHLILYLD